jgi:hypothetical protein
MYIDGISWADEVDFSLIKMMLKLEG